MSRPVKVDPRDRFKSFRLTEAEVTRLEARARASGRTFSEYVRMKALEGSAGEPESEGSRAGPGETSTGHPTRGELRDRMLADQVRRIGVNLNQIAHRMNELRIPPPDDLARVLTEIRAYVRQAWDP